MTWRDPSEEVIGTIFGLSAVIAAASGYSVFSEGRHLGPFLLASVVALFSLAISKHRVTIVAALGLVLLLRILWVLGLHWLRQ